MGKINLYLMDNIEKCVQKSLIYILSSQRPEGFWRDFKLGVGQSTQWVTGYVSHSIGLTTKNSDYLQKACQWLIKTEHADGGWGYNQSIIPDADSTANVLLFFARNSQELLIDQKLSRLTKGLIKFVNESDGGFRTYYPLSKKTSNKDSFMYQSDSGWCVSHLSVTAMAAEVLHLINKYKYSNLLDKATIFIYNMQTHDGFWESYWWCGRMYSTYRAARFLSLRGDNDKIYHAAKWLMSIVNQNGSWGNGFCRNATPFHTALAVSTLMLIQDCKKYKYIIDKAIFWLTKVQQGDGSWLTVPILRVTRPDVFEPWKNPYKFPNWGIVKDHNRLFTTATVYSALTSYQLMFGR